MHVFLYREVYLLFKKGVSSAANKERIAIVVSHELAHQWFGNLVTPSWWTDLWLNEGFASYVEYLGVEAVQPQFKLLEQFVMKDLQLVMRLDALSSSHPISIPVKHPDDISSIFDRISYSKGASIIRMMDHFLTRNSFRFGLKKYLDAFKFKAAEQDDLWHYLTMQAHEDGTLDKDVTVKQIMDTWTLQMGFPVINVDRNYDDNSAKVTQERFLAIKGQKAEDDDHDYKWWVPLNFAAPGEDFTDTRATHWLKPDEGRKTIDGLPSKSKAVIFNKLETGYYTVNYDKRNWQLIIDQLNDDHEAIPVINRAQIIDDAFNLARGGLLEYEVALGVTSYLHRETEFICWKAALTGFSYISHMLERTASYGDFKRYMRTLVVPIYNKVGFDARGTDAHLDKLLRQQVVAWACGLELPECVENAQANYRRWMAQVNPDQDGSNPVNVDLKSTVYCNAIRHGGEEEWDFAWQRYNNTNVGSEKSNLLSAVTCTKEPWLLNRLLNMTIYKESGIRTQDSRIVIGRVASNLIGRDLAFDFARDKWDRIFEIYQGTSFAMSHVVKSLLKGRNTRFSVDEAKNFAKNFPLSSAERAAKQAIEGGENNIKWMAANYDTISAWLKKQNERNVYF